MKYLRNLIVAYTKFKNGLVDELGLVEIKDTDMFLSEGLRADLDYCYLVKSPDKVLAKIEDIEDLLEKEESNLDYTVNGKEVEFINKASCTYMEWFEACEKIERELEEWKGENYDDDNKSYIGQVSVKGKVISFCLEAYCTEDGICFPGDSVELKRVR